MTQVAAETPALPAIGQVVTVRNRPWVVADVRQGSVAGSDDRALTSRAPHVVSLVSIEDDARDERLRVVWELEPGAAAYEQHALPSPARGFDPPGHLDAFLDAVRWGAIASADTTVLQAPFRSGIQIEEYQLDPVVRALSMPRTNLLIADDVGLGKTIEAGLVMQELMLRHRARTMLIVCPAGLTLQWRDEMRDKFGLDFRIVDSGLLKELRRTRGLYANPWTHFPRLIVSVDWLKRDRPRRLLRDVLPPVPRYPRAFDLLVVDEVHTCAPATRGKYAVDSQRTEVIRELAPHCEHRLFLSATPHNGYQNSWTALLELLDDQRFARGVPPSDEQLAQVMIRRLKSELPPKWDGSSRFATRKIHDVDVRYSELERQAHLRLAEYAESRRRTSGGNAQRSAADFVTMLLKKRLFSSPQAFFSTVDKHLETMVRREDGERPLPAKAQARVLRPLVDRLEETAEDDAAYGEAETSALTAARRLLPPLTAGEKKLLGELRDWAGEAKKQPDAKFDAMRAWLDPIVRPDGEWNDDNGERVIIFTEYRDTQNWLRDQLIHAGYPARLIACLYGGMDDAERDRIRKVFRDSPDLDPMRILLATDAASEGINLQDHCHRLLHWEIPWNPNRLEQRNGRIDRHGQPAPQVDIFHFVPSDWRDAREGSLEDELQFLTVAVRKVDQIREDLGSAGDVIAANVERKMLGRPADWQAAETEITKRSGTAQLKIRRDLAADLEKLTETLRGSRTKLNLTPQTVERVVRTALRLAHNRDLLDADPPKGLKARCFRLPPLSGAWAEARNDGLLHPVTHAERVVTFDQDAAADRTNVVLLHLGSRLVQMCLHLLRAELWASGVGGGAKLARVTARVVPADLITSPAVVAHMRIVVTGDEGTRLHEEVVLGGGTLDEGRLTRVNAESLESWLAAATDEPPPRHVLDRLTEVWERLELEPKVAGILADRARRRTNRHATDLQARCEKDIAAMTAVLDELRRTITAALDDDGYWQPSLFEADEERTQLARDREALVERRESIPRQLADEIEAITRRYANPTVRWFPAAVTFLVPASIAHRGA
ncbi:DISARM system SNF2-like helicase DrmD [Streptosporangium sp. NBC_01755]|uniref:DISARM system SNF2-like helicase DrmD n=1 Tax=Streptosporangium sp. NBC_01755 TaxID=2975949 RepID=UPI002DDA3CAA|nr:DISARM system SNF2-like helicase DrmD [Streptosporangium sp. NBC_01755]WSC98552.1 DISARM system SNF2-like helicase DrmD [Streptosporangium sp. NBC_01755]